MNAGLNKEQIEYIQSIVGKTKYDYQVTQDDEIPDEEFHLSYPNEGDYEKLDEKTDRYWYDQVRSFKSIFEKKTDENKRFSPYWCVVKIGERHFSFEYYTIFIDGKSLEDLNLYPFSVYEVFPKEVTTIVFDYKP